MCRCLFPWLMIVVVLPIHPTQSHQPIAQNNEQEFLQSLGYAEGAACFEWEGHLAAGQEAKDNLILLQTALSLLTAVKNGAAPAWPEEALLEGGGEGAGGWVGGWIMLGREGCFDACDRDSVLTLDALCFDESCADEEEPEQEREQEPSVAAAAAANDDAPPLDEARVHALLHPNSPPPPQQQQQEGAEAAGRPAAAGENKTDSAPSSPLSAAAETTAVLLSPSSSSVVGTGGEGQGQGGEPPLATPPPPNPQYPKSFMEVRCLLLRSCAQSPIIFCVRTSGRHRGCALLSHTTPTHKPSHKTDHADGGARGDARRDPAGGEPPLRRRVRRPRFPFSGAVPLAAGPQAVGAGGAGGGAGAAGGCGVVVSERGKGVGEVGMGLCELWVREGWGVRGKGGGGGCTRSCPLSHTNIR